MPALQRAVTFSSWDHVGLIVHLDRYGKVCESGRSVDVGVVVRRDIRRDHSPRWRRDRAGASRRHIGGISAASRRYLRRRATSTAAITTQSPTISSGAGISRSSASPCADSRARRWMRWSSLRRDRRDIYRDARREIRRDIRRDEAGLTQALDPWFHDVIGRRYNLVSISKISRALGGKESAEASDGFICSELLAHAYKVRH